MRIDKFLKVSRLIKRREVAKELCDDGDVTINGRVAKPGTEVANDDNVVLVLGRHTITLRILDIRPFANKEDASKMYEIISDIVEERSLNA